MYHGTYISEDRCDFKNTNQIDLKVCNKNTDFGLGFYLTEDEEQAKKERITCMINKKLRKKSKV